MFNNFQSFLRISQFRKQWRTFKVQTPPEVPGLTRTNKLQTKKGPNPVIPNAKNNRRTEWPMVNHKHVLHSWEVKVECNSLKTLIYLQCNVWNTKMRYWMFNFEECADILQTNLCTFRYKRVSEPLAESPWNHPFIGKATAFFKHLRY